jgi:hypothetical protein
MQPIKRGVVKLARRQKRIQDGDVTLETLRRAWIMLLPQWASSESAPGTWTITADSDTTRLNSGGVAFRTRQRDSYRSTPPHIARTLHGLQPGTSFRPRSCHYSLPGSRRPIRTTW